MKVFTCILIVLLVLLQHRLWSGKNSWPDYLQLKTEIFTQTLENKKLIAKNKLQFKEIKDLKNGLEAVEERARNQLGLIKEGESFYRFVE